MTGVIVQSPAKRQLIDFIQNSEMDEDYTFEIVGDEQQAHAFVQQMRVALSRFRKMVVAQGKQLRPFKMLLISVEELPPESGHAIKTKITLRQSMAGHTKISEQLGDVLDRIAKPHLQESKNG